MLHDRASNASTIYYYNILALPVSNVQSSYKTFVQSDHRYSIVQYNANYINAENKFIKAEKQYAAVGLEL